MSCEPSAKFDSASVDWQAFAAKLADISHSTDPDTLTTKSRDFYWYSPILKSQLDRCRGDLLVTPSSEDELLQVVRHCVEHRVPITVRGGGTGNYGQAVPLQGGVILETTKLNKVLEVGDGYARVQAGARISAVDDAARQSGQEVLIYPSTKRSATIGGFVAGGSAGIGSARHGMLRDPGVIRRLRVVSCEAPPRVIELTGDAVNHVHHAYGTNGIVTELEIALTPAEEWVQCLTLVDSYAQAIELCKATHAADIKAQLLATVDARIVPMVKPLRGKVAAGKHLMLAILLRCDFERYRDLLPKFDAELAYSGDEAEFRRQGLPAITEFAYNHTTLQVLKVDKSITYLQVLFPSPVDTAKIEHFIELFGDEVLPHHEFVLAHGQLVAFAIPIIRYTTPERLYEIVDAFEAEGCPVFDPHTYVKEDGGMKQIDPEQIAFKHEADPLGLLNPGKLRGWPGFEEPPKVVT
ncbi:MAG: FAD-binding oxidoreductase [Planctomycetota bacterium]